jgi:hypothetical protein
MKPIAQDRCGGANHGAVGLILVVCIAAGYYLYHQRQETERQRQAADAIRNFLEAQQRERDLPENFHERTKPAGDAAIATYVGKKARVSNTRYFAAFGGVPGFLQPKDAARFSFPELMSVDPVPNPQPAALTKNLLLASNAVPPPAWIPLDSDFEVLDALEAQPPIGLAQLVLKVRVSGRPPREFYVHSAALTPLP